jgi:lipoprotein-anchoring transpeptidase ErfK/SrfK
MQRRGVAILLAAGIAAGCGGVSETHAKPTPTAAPAAAATVAAPACRAGARIPVGSAKRSYAAVVNTRTQAYRAPGRGPFAALARRNVNGVPMVLGILGKRVDARCRARWYHVELPLKPNGATGWVPARAVLVGVVRTRIVVDVSARRVTLYRDGKPVLSTRAAVGSSATPTPLGRYYVNQRLVPRDPGGPYGPGAIGVSAFSRVLTGWTQGGPIAIHGTSEPWSIGRAVSNGCIRVPNPVLRRLFRSTLSGTPVIIKA